MASKIPALMAARILGGGTALSSGGLFNFLLSQFRTTVPGTQTGTFQETHVYTGGTKWLLKANGFLGSTTAPQEPVLFDTNGNRLGILLEPSATNSCLWSDDCTNAAWVKSNITAAKNATGADGVANSASTLTATSANGTCLQSFTSTIQSRSYAARVRRKTGTGNIQMTVDNGVTWTTVTTTSSWTRVNISQASVTNPVIGWRIVTSGDEIEVQLNQLENATLTPTSDIPTTTAAVTRTADTCYRVLGPEAGSTQYSLAMDATSLTGAGASWCGPAINDASANNIAALSVYLGDGNVYVGSGGASQFNPSLGAWVYGERKQQAVGLALNNMRAAQSGTLSALDTSCAMPVAPVRLSIDQPWVTNQGQKIIHRVLYWPTRLADADLQNASNGTYASGAALDFNYQTGVYQYTPVNAGVTTTYDLATLVSNSVLTFTSPSAKWVRGPSGTLVEVAAGQIAIEYDVNGQSLGCYNRELARTNSVRPSVLSHANWTADGGAKTASGTDPFGNANGMSLLTENGATSTHRFYNVAFSYTGTAANWTCSYFVRKAANARRYVMIHVGAGGGASNAWAVFDTTTGTFSQNCTTNGTWTAVSQEVQSWGTDLWRIGITWLSTAVQQIPQIAGAAASTVANPDTYTYAGDSTSTICASDCVLEAGSYMSSHIPTTSSAAVTRLADQLRLNLGSWFDSSRWIVAAKYYFPRTNATSGSTLTALWELDLATPSANNYAATWLSSTNRIDFLERTASTDGAAGNATTLSFPATVRSAFGWSPSNAKASLNGATQTLTGTPSTAANQQPFVSIDLSDSQRANVDQGGGYIQSIAIYPIVPAQENVNQYAGAI